MGTAVIPTLAGVGALFLVLLLIHGGEFAFRFVTCKVPKGSKRTLRGIDTRRIEAQLRQSAPVGNISNLVTTQSTVEVQGFAEELRELLERCQWQPGQIGFWQGDPSRDVEIELPIEGNRGLEALGKFLNRHGSKATLIASRGGSSTATIVVGEATQ